MKKRILSLFLVLVMMLSIVPTVALAADSTVKVWTNHSVYEWIPTLEKYQALPAGVSEITAQRLALASAVSANNVTPATIYNEAEEKNVGSYSVAVPSGKEGAVVKDTTGITMTHTYREASYSWSCVGYFINYSAGNFKTDVHEWTSKELTEGTSTVQLSGDHGRNAIINYVWVPSGKGKDATPEATTVTLDYNLDALRNMSEGGLDIQDGDTVELYGYTAASANTSFPSIRLNIDNGTYSKISDFSSENPTKKVSWPVGYAVDFFNITEYTNYVLKVTRGTQETYFYSETGYLLSSDSSGSVTGAYVPEDGLTFYVQWYTLDSYTIDRDTMYDVTTSFSSELDDDSVHSQEDFDTVTDQINYPDPTVLKDAKKPSPTQATYTVPRPTTTSMSEADIADTTVTPYLIKEDAAGNEVAKWECIGFYYITYSIKQNSQQSSPIYVYDDNWDYFALGSTITLPEGSEYYTYDKLPIVYIWKIVGNSVTYDLNIATNGSPTTGQLPKGAEVYLIKKAENGVESIYVEKVAQNDLKKLTVREGNSFTVCPTSTAAGYLGRVKNSDGSFAYYRLDGWSDGTSTYQWGTSVTMGNTDITLTAQWAEIPKEQYTGNVSDDGFPQMPLAENSNTAFVTQTRTDRPAEWTADLESAPLIIGDDGLVYYKAEAKMTLPVAGMLANQKIWNSDFAMFDIHVSLDEDLELVDADEDGNIQFSFTSTFLRPDKQNYLRSEAIIKCADGTDLGTYLYTETASNISTPLGDGTQYTYTYTVPTADLNRVNGNFILPMKWRSTNDGYNPGVLRQDMTLEMAVAKLPDSTNKIFKTGGYITGSIDFDKATDIQGNNLMTGTKTYEMARSLLESDQVWADYCGTDIVGFLKAVECLDLSAKNSLLPGNNVYAKAAEPEYTVTYDANGGEGSMESQTYTVGDNATVAANSFTRSGYTFTGWNAKADGTGTAYKANDTFAMPASDVTLYAQWEAIYYPPYVPPAEPDKPVLNTEDHVAYIIGYVDGTVRPLNDISRSEVATIFFRLLTDESRAYYWSQTNPYSDVDAGDWCNNAISTLSNAGIITGYPDGTFRPEAPITRSEFAAIAARFSEVVWNGGNSFSDVPENHWAARYIALAEHLGWITGYPDGTFKPEQNITRAESMTLINRVLERDVEDEHMLEDMVKWPDNLPGAWYYEAVQEATNSHEYVRTDKLVPEHDFNYEDWQEILEVPDWAALEKAWSTANSK